MRKFAGAVCIIAFTLFILTSCSDRFSKQLLTERLRSSYSCRGDIIISNHSNNVIASADIKKSDITTLSFLSPEQYKGINIKSDKTSKPDIISFEYLGIPAEIPKSIFSEFSLLFTLFSDEVPNIIESLPKDAFKTEGDIGEVFFLKNNISLRIVYHLESGIPKSFEAGNDEISVSLVPKNIKYT